jgi:thymidylate kinase
LKDIYIIEGLDRLGKSTLIKNIQHRFGFYQVIHFGKPEMLDKYQIEACGPGNDFDKSYTLKLYQEASFKNMFRLMSSPITGTRVIFDRAHLGELVYAPMYRGYSGDYVMELERIYAMEYSHRVRMILLTEDFSTSKHFVEDGDSFDPTKRQEEQEKFIKAFNASIIPDKRIVCVTDPSTGQFKEQKEILREATSATKENLPSGSNHGS